jgi:hypothetical protein
MPFSRYTVAIHLGKIMKRIIATIATMLVVLGPSICLGEDQTSPAYDHLKALEWMIGDWVGEYTMPEGTPEWGEAGAKIQSRASFRWAPNKSFIILEGCDIVGGKPGSWIQEFIAWDAANGKLVHRLFSDNGGFGDGVWSKHDDGWHLKWSATGPDKTKYTGTSVLASVSPDAYSWQMKDMTKDAEALPTWPKVTLRRVAAPAAIPDNLREEIEHLVGQWSVDLTQGDEKTTAIWSVEWAPGKTCLIYTWQVTSSSSIEGPLPISTAVAGWDADKKQWTQLGFSSNGDHDVLRYKLTEDDVWIGDGHGMSEGEAFTQKQTATFVDGRDEFIWKVTDLVAGGEKQDDIVARFRRIK